MTRILNAQPLSAATFAPFGTVLGEPVTPPLLARGDITYWHATAGLSGLGSRGVTGHLLAHRRALHLNRIERHNHTPEAFIATAGHSLLVVGTPGDADVSGLCAFEIRAGQAVLLHQGTWHWAPYPLSETATFLLLLQADTPTHDIEMADVPFTTLQPLAQQAVSGAPGPSP